MDNDFEQMYETYYMQVYSFAMTLAKSQHLAEEITQKTFFKVITTNSRYRGNSSELTWLCSIAKNLFIDEMRAQSKKSELDTDGLSENSLESNFDDESMSLKIHQVIHELEEPYKEVFSLRVFGELSFKKIGMVFAKSENWARVTYHRSRLKIKEKMEEKQ